MGCKMAGRSQKTDWGYITEMKIPLSSLRYPENSTQWRINVYRAEIGANRQSSWANIPRNQIIAGLAFMKTLDFERNLSKPKVPFAIIPFTSGITTKDFDANATSSALSAGGDAKISIGDGMILDLTFNPDFSQVEVDDQIINISRFEVRLPEKRQFLFKIVICSPILEIILKPNHSSLDALGWQKTVMETLSKIKLLLERVLVVISVKIFALAF